MALELPDGILIVDKPLGWTSMDVCGYIRRHMIHACRENGIELPRSRRRPPLKVGHAGTLDPLATGVLVVCVGKATKQVLAWMGAEKKYTAEVDLSQFSETDDAEGPFVSVAIDKEPTLKEIEAACEAMTGEQVMQVPPAYSALHVQGNRAYELARAGEDFVLKERPVCIKSIEVLDYQFPRLSLKVVCGKGTYIRAIARDIGLACGVGGYLVSLCREQVGACHLAQAIDLKLVEDSQIALQLVNSDIKP